MAVPSWQKEAGDERLPERTGAHSADRIPRTTVRCPERKLRQDYWVTRRMFLISYLNVLE